jgi:hypothetical protein
MTATLIPAADTRAWRLAGQLVKEISQTAYEAGLRFRPAIIGRFGRR